MLIKESEPEPGFQQETDLMGFATSEASPGCLGGTGFGGGWGGGVFSEREEALSQCPGRGAGGLNEGCALGLERKAG